METTIADEERGEAQLPWNDAIKNFVMDLVSLQADGAYATCILLLEEGATDTESGRCMLSFTLEGVARRYCRDTSVTVTVEPVEASFRLLRHESGSIVDNRVERAQNLVRLLSRDASGSNTLILCHDSSLQSYRDVLTVFAESTWSISCTPQSFVGSAHASIACKYVCSVFAHRASRESRAVGKGRMTFDGSDSGHTMGTGRQE